MAYTKKRREKALLEECGALPHAADKIARLGKFRRHGRFILDQEGREVCYIELPAPERSSKRLPAPALTAHQLDVFTALIVRQLNRG